jgi:hypothetical protein
MWDARVVEGQQRSGKRVLAGIVVAHVVVTAVTWRDLRRRAPEQVRGSKRFWRVVSGANTIGSGAYYLVGRK